jgi:uncharacterized membrane protein
MISRSTRRRRFTLLSFPESLTEMTLNPKLPVIAAILVVGFFRFSWNVRLEALNTGSEYNRAGHISVGV